MYRSRIFDNKAISAADIAPVRGKDSCTTTMKVHSYIEPNHNQDFKTELSHWSYVPTQIEDKALWYAMFRLKDMIESFDLPVSLRLTRKQD